MNQPGRAGFTGGFPTETSRKPARPSRDFMRRIVSVSMGGPARWPSFEALVVSIMEGEKEPCVRTV